MESCAIRNRPCPHKSRLFGNRWLPQTTCAGCAGSSGNLLPPSPPAEKASARQDKIRKASTERFAASILLMELSGQLFAQSVRIGPGGVEIRPGGPRDELSERMLGLRVACQDGDRRACVRLGIIIGEHKERHEEWRRAHPDVFFYER
jgi:hypothetical protein